MYPNSTEMCLAVLEVQQYVRNAIQFILQHDVSKTRFHRIFVSKHEKASTQRGEHICYLLNLKRLAILSKSLDKINWVTSCNIEIICCAFIIFPVCVEISIEFNLLSTRRCLESFESSEWRMSMMLVIMPFVMKNKCRRDVKKLDGLTLLIVDAPLLAPSLCSVGQFAKTERDTH